MAGKVPTRLRVQGSTSTYSEWGDKILETPEFKSNSSISFLKNSCETNLCCLMVYFSRRLFVGLGNVMSGVFSEFVGPLAQEGKRKGRRLEACLSLTKVICR